MVAPRRWVAEHGYFETVYQQALERGTRSDVLVSPDGRYVAIFQQQDVLFLSTETGEVAHRLLGAYASVQDSKFSYDGRYFVAYLGRVDPTLKRGPGPNQINTTNDRLMIRIDLAEGFARKIFFPNEEMCHLFPGDCKKAREFDFLNKDIGLSGYEIDLVSRIDGEANFYFYNYVTGAAHKFKSDYIDSINSVRVSEMKIPKKHKYINAKTVLEPDEVIGDARANCIESGFSDRVYVDCGSLTFPEGRYKYFIMTYDYAQKKTDYVYVDGYRFVGLFGPASTVVKGNYVIYLGDADIRDPRGYYTHYSYQVFELQPKLRQVFREDDFASGVQSKKRLGVLLRGGGDDTIFIFTPGPNHEIVMSDLFLNVKRRVRVPFKALPYAGGISVSADGKTIAGRGENEQIHLIQLP